MGFINCTPHELNIYRTDGTVLTLAPSGNIVRVVESRMTDRVENGITFNHVVYGEIDYDGLDLESVFNSNTIVIVSSMVLAALPLSYAGDFTSPGEAVRNEANQIIGCRGLTIR